MAMNRLTRDQICNRGLDLADSAALDAKDRPAGTIVSTAFSITWLQEALDLFAKRFPFSQDITTTTFSLAIDATTFAVPADFVLDYKNGLLLDSPNEARLIRQGLSRLLNISSSTKGRPAIYAVRGSTIQTAPKTDKAYTGVMWYYKLPAVLASGDVPLFPDDYILTHYVWLKAKEWHNAVPPGTALKYAEDRINDLQRAGIGNEAEDDQIGIDPTFASGGDDRYDAASWLGKDIAQ